MAINDQELEVKIKTVADTKGVDDTVKSIDKLEKHSDSGSRAVAALGTTAKVAAAGVAIAGTAIAAAGTAAIKSAGEYEQNRIAFETMLGGADKARALLTEIADFSKSTPFELDEVVTASKQLLAFGFAQDKIIPTMRKLGDIASGVGVPVGQLAYVFGQVRVAGKLMGGDLMQFTNAGVPMIEELSKVLKVSQGDVKKMVEQGKVGFPEVEKALDNLTGANSRFGGMMDKQSKSFSGIVSNIKDSFSQIMRSAVGITPAGDIVAGSVFDRIKQAAEAVMPVLSDFAAKVGPTMQTMIEYAERLWPQIENVARSVGEYLSPKFLALWDTLETKLLPVLTRLWKEVIEPLIPVIGTALVGALGLAIDTVNALFAVLTPVINWMLDNKEVVLAFAAAFGTLWATMKVKEGVDTFMTMMNTIKNVTIPGVQGALSGLNGSLTGFMGWGVFAAAAVAAFVLIDQKAKQTIALLDDIAGKRANVDKGTDAALRRAKEQYAEGKISKERYNQIIQGAYANGTSFHPGGLALVGEKGPEIVNLPRGSQVYPNGQSQQMMGQTTIHIAAVNLTTPEATREFFAMQDRNALLASKGMSVARA